jgi:hypothetical protein
MRHDKHREIHCFKNLSLETYLAVLYLSFAAASDIPWCCNYPMLQPELSNGAPVIPCHSQNYPMVLPVIPCHCQGFSVLLSVASCKGLFHVAAKNYYPIRLPTCPRVACDGLPCES